MSLTLTTAERDSAARLLELALEEDLGQAGDITSQTLLPADLTGRVQIVPRKPGTVAGLPIVEMVFARIDPEVRVELRVSDGTAVTSGQVLAEISGRVLTLLAGERTALNFLTHLSGIATRTAEFVQVIAGTRAGIYDTRKTLPGWRRLAKYAVRAGGGHNHRMGLFDAVLIKDNHLGAWQQADQRHSLADAIRKVRAEVPAGTIVEIEVDTLEQLADALPALPDIVLLDNMGPDMLREAVQLRDRVAPRVELEASGGINLQTVRAIAETGVERISSGALTHSAPQLDIGFDWV